MIEDPRFYQARGLRQNRDSVTEYFMQYYTYILKSNKDNSYYIGYTQNIVKRIRDHNKGLSKYTKLRRPYILVFKNEFKVRREAIKYERYLKSLKKRAYLEKIINSSN